GLFVYDSVAKQLMEKIGSAAIPNWQAIVNGNSSGAWSLTGNNNINPANQFLGTADNQPLRFRINNIKAGEINSSGNIFLGLRAGQSNTSGFSNVAIGTDALKTNTSIGNLIAIG